MKVLIVRFSSIGDVVLTTPIIRALKKQIPTCEIHYITKENNREILADNPYIDQLFTIQKSITECVDKLKAQQFDYLIDLHKNTRTLSLKKQLGVPYLTFPKLNIEKWLLVNFKWNRMPDIHIVDRYFKAVENLGVQNDLLPCDFFIPEDQKIATESNFKLKAKSYLTIAIGAQFATKRMNFELLEKIIAPLNFPIVLVGGPTDANFAHKLIQRFPEKQLISACGNYSLSQSASIVQQAKAILTNDTGLMHIASCFEIPTISVWGNTVPVLGMYPYFPRLKNAFSMHEVENLKCRPCSKIGFQQCPKKHFSCMNNQNVGKILASIEEKMNA
jgi:ADP-heptose:LPS heptosyltransferase